jgi:hypothetical protein
MHKRALTGLLIAIALLGLSRPSSAAVTASLSIVGSATLTVKCPVNVKFAGTIGGTPGTTFTYSFNRFVNSVQKVVNGATVTMPGSGSIAVNDSIPIAASTSGTTFDQIWVHNISGGQPDVYSNAPNFSVTCGSVTMPIMQGMILSVAVAAPTNVVATRDVNLCAKHINMLFCKAAIDSSDQPLVWDWAGNASYPTLDGYKVYRVDHGHHDLVETTSAGDGVHGTFIGAMGLANGRCFVVTGYAGSHESPPSAQACVSP